MQPVENDSSHGASSDVSNHNIPKTRQDVNPDYKQSFDGRETANPSVGAEGKKDGTVFDLSETTNEADRADGGVTENGSLATSNGAASSETSVIGDTAAGHRQTQPLVPVPDNSISENGPCVNPACNYSQFAYVGFATLI